MDTAHSAPNAPDSTAASTDYTRFIVLGGGRTGSNMLAQALDSSPCITCFGEIFNRQIDFIGFNVAGYDNYSGDDIALRDRDLEQFLRRRIYCPHPRGTSAVGFKLLYVHVWGFRGLLDRLLADTDIRVLHLRRRNLLRMLISTRIAQKTGVWIEQPRLTPANLRTALRHPMRVIARLRRPLRRPNASQIKVTVTEQQCLRFFSRIEETVGHFDRFFADHPKHTLFYEDMVDHRDDVLARAQEFLGVRPAPLTVGTRKQNPEPLQELIANYDELRRAFRDTDYAAFFH